MYRALHCKDKKPIRKKGPSKKHRLETTPCAKEPHRGFLNVIKKILWVKLTVHFCFVLANNKKSS
jgi:hypothetical protein